MIYLLSLMSFLSIKQFDEDDITAYIFQVLEHAFEALGALIQAIWEGFWGLVEAWVNMDNAFWISLVMIMVLSVYVILKKGGLI